MITAALSIWLMSASATAPLVAQADPSVTAPSAQPYSVGREDDEEEAPRGSAEEESALASLGLRERYFPMWFPSDLHPQLETWRWTYVLGGIFVPTSTVWGPYFMVKPHPDVDVREFVKNAIVRTVIQIAGHVAIYAAYIVLGITCPPYLGFYLWAIPMYAATIGWMAFGYFQTQLTNLVTWDAMLKDQGTPDEPKGRKHKRAD